MLNSLNSSLRPNSLSAAAGCLSVILRSAFKLCVAFGYYSQTLQERTVTEV